MARLMKAWPFFILFAFSNIPIYTNLEKVSKSNLKGLSEGQDARAENKSLLRRGGFGGLEDPGDQRLPEGNTCGLLKKGKVWLQDL